MEESDSVGTCSVRQEIKDAVSSEREASMDAATEALSIMLRLRGEKPGMNIEGSRFVGCSDSESDMQALKDVVCAQHILLQKLNAELDSEREASATAVSEALAMILRLQGEKAAVIMETSQYKRMAEEKIFYAEEYLELFEDVINEKDMEIASLEYQIQAYRCKLLSLGYNDLGLFENKIPESLSHGSVHRMSSLPAVEVKDSYHKESTSERKKNVTPALDLSLGTVEESKKPESNVRRMELEINKKTVNSGAVDLNLYRERVEKLNEHVKEIPKCDVLGKDTSAGLKLASEFSSLVPQTSTLSPFNQVGNEVSIKDPIEFWEPISETAVKSACPSTVLDIFEIPKHDHICKSRSDGMNEQSDLLFEVENRLGKPDVASDEAFLFKDENKLPKKMLKDELSEARNLKKIDRLSPNFDTVFSADETRAQFRQLSRRVQLLEEERSTGRQETSAEGTEQQQLLKEICDKLNFIQSKFKSSNTRKASSRNDSSSVSLMEEAMLYFWF